MTNELLQLVTPPEIQRQLADRVRVLRLSLGFKQSTLARRSGVTLASLRRFEQIGEASLKHFLMICHALGRSEEFTRLLQPPPARTLAELESRVARPTRRRGSK
jgi:transcriptional regulator with XRE-family HTH domain